MSTPYAQGFYVSMEDPYPPKAKVICKKFLELYGFSAATKCVANCLGSAESSTVLLPACGARNVKRLRDHARCYSNCGFVPTNGLPEGGAEVGWNDVLPDVCGTW